MARRVGLFALVSLVALGALSATAGLPPPVWKSLSKTETIEVVTHDEDGSPRVTTVWLAVYGGQGYIRTAHTTWGANIERDPNVLVRVDDREYSLVARPIQSGPTYDAITQVFREKYGLTDQLIGLVRDLAGPPVIMRLDGLPGIPMASPAAKQEESAPESPAADPAPDAPESTSDSAPAN